MTEIAMRTDITRKLELVASLKPGDPWPGELGQEIGSAHNWATALSAICAEALAEIQRLREHREGYATYAGETIRERDLALAEIKRLRGQEVFVLPSKITVQDWRTVVRAATVEVTAPEPWGSSFAMNTENWK